MKNGWGTNWQKLQPVKKCTTLCSLWNFGIQLKIALELQPLVVDGDERPAMPEVAALMNHAKEKIKLSFATENKKTLLKNIIKIIEKRWVTQMDHSLYGAALYLNPVRLHSLFKLMMMQLLGS